VNVSDPEPRRWSVLLIHHDTDLLDLLTRIFEAADFTVSVAATAMHAMSQLAADRDYDVIVAGWDASHGLGGVVYRWVLRNRLPLRGQFVFLADEPPPDFDKLVAGRCLAVRPDDVEEVVQVAQAAARRRLRVHELAEAEAWLDSDRPTLLLADDEPTLLSVMARLLTDAGFAVTAVDGGNAAMAELDRSDFDVVLLDWLMTDGTAAEVYQWVSTFRPWLVDRVVFISGSTVAEVAEVAPGRPVVPKGQDSPALVRLLTGIAKSSRTAKRVL
jgi:DNA-binding response OmpR family regulator